MQLSPEATPLHPEKLAKIFQQQGSEVIYQFANWLQELGLTLTVTTSDCY